MLKRKKTFFVGVGFLFAFLLWTLLVRFVDVQAIGPRESLIGFATINDLVRRLIGTNMDLYAITDWLGLVPIAVAIGFAVLGLVQWIKRRRLIKVDYSLLILGGFYVVVMMVYAFFEWFVINYRPLLIDGYLEASYPSSTTMLVMCVMPTAFMQFCARIKNKIHRRIVAFIVAIFTALMVIGRIVAGVHWITDIVGGVLISVGLVLLYYSISGLNFSIK